jgi:hypothetical protein
LLKKTAFDIDKGAKLQSPVKTGRLRSSIHVKFRPTDAFLYTDSAGEVHSGGLKTQIVEGKEVIVGTNVEYGRKMDAKYNFMQAGKDYAQAPFEKRKEKFLKDVVNGKPNISIT